MSKRPAGIDPKIWGRAAWSLLYRSVVHDPSGKLTKSILRLYACLLPCGKCRRFTRQYVRTYGLESTTPFELVYLLHKTVACKTNTCIPSREQLKDRYYKYGSDVSESAVQLFLRFVKENTEARNKSHYYESLVRLLDDLEA